MSRQDPDAADVRQRERSWRAALSWIATGIIAFPIAVLLHELGHFVSYLVFGFDGVVLRYARADFAGGDAFWQHIAAGDYVAAEAIAPLWQEATAVGAAVVISYLTVLICGYVAMRYRPYPLVVAVGLVAPLRFISVVALIYRPSTAKLAYSPDEVKLVQLTGIPPGWLIVGGAICLVGGWVWLIKSLPRQQRIFATVSLTLGLIVGGGLYANVIGPWLLP